MTRDTSAIGKGGRELNIDKHKGWTGMSHGEPTQVQTVVQKKG